MDLFTRSHYQENRYILSMILRRFQKNYNYKYLYQLAPNYFNYYLNNLRIHSRFVKLIQMYFFA